MTKLSFETQASHSPGKRPYVITRGGGAGIARYGQTWSGDNETAWKTLRFNLTQGLNMSLSGLYNIGHDVGGFHGPSPGPELFCRFAEFCALWPRMVMNSWKEDGTVNQPWMHPEVLPQVRAAIELRHRLLPYLYTQMWRATRDDVPVVRPLFFDFPDDGAARDVQDAFMLGPDLLVAPVLEEGETQRELYLPGHPGGWYDWHDGKHFEGGRAVRVDAPLGRLPLFARAGALVPTETSEGLVLAAFGASSGHGSGTLYLDDGDTAQWREAGRCVALELNQTAGGAALSAIITDGEPSSPLVLKVRLVGLAQLALPARSSQFDFSMQD